jgi:hypothetical protein
LWCHLGSVSLKSPHLLLPENSNGGTGLFCGAVGL